MHQGESDERGEGRCGPDAPDADRADRAAVLRRRLAFLQEPSSFFYDGDGEPVTAENEPNPFRRGMLLVARASGAAERAWLAETVADLDTAAGAAGP
ncbi:hypothetical protein [Streptomyces sp. NRRL B-24484]|uniref:hypothetical protein n=1 Tax=Streptomyces sp. NRRL B-24484 TaxID=1463833 RepID=UPI0004BEA64E|nr:hypothetical protein [Streptomyces sp. NRRL B-24484]